MSKVMDSIGKVFSSPSFGPAASAGALGIGEIGNLLAGRQQQQEANVLKVQQDKIANMTPEQLSQMAVKAQAPINQSLVQAINNSVQGDMASRGLAEAPGIFAATESQALAPFVQQNYNTALQQVIAQLGLPAEYAASIAKLLPQQQNMTPAMMMMLQQFAKQKRTTPPTLPTNPSSPAAGGIDPSLLDSLLSQGAGA